MGKTHIVLTFDIGTQSTRALLISSEGQILAKAQKGYQHMCRVARQLKESYPEEFRQIEAVTLTTIKYVLLGTYLNYKLTGKLRDSTASIVGYVPYDFKNRRWKKKNDLVRPVFDIPNEMMCDLAEPGETIGHLTPQAAEDLELPVDLKLIATGTDKACEVLGLGCVNKKRAAISFGTTATITFTTDHYLEPENSFSRIKSSIGFIGN